METGKCGLCYKQAVSTQLLDLTHFPLCSQHLPTLACLPEEPKDAAGLEALADSLQAEAGFYEAAGLLSKALALRRSGNDPLAFDTAYRLAYLQVTFLECPDLAIPLLRSNIACASTRSTLECTKLLAQALLDSYSYQEASQLLSEAVSPLPVSPELFRLHILQARCLQLQGHRDQAELKLLQTLERVESLWPGSELEAETQLYLASVSKTAVYAEQALQYYNSSAGTCEELLKGLQSLLVGDSFTVSKWTGLHLRPPTSPLAAQVTHLFNAIHKVGETEAVARIRAYRPSKGPALARELHLYACIHEYDPEQAAAVALRQALDICIQTGSLVAIRYMDLVTLVYDTWEQAESYLQQVTERTGRVIALVRYYLMKDQPSAALALLHQRLSQASLQTRADLAQFCYCEAPLKSLAADLYTQLLTDYEPGSLPTAEAYYRLGTLALDLEHYSEAQSCLQSALDIYKDADLLSAAACWKRLGVCYQSQHCLESAVEAFHRSICLYRDCHPAARFTIAAIGALADCQGDSQVWSEVISSLRQGGNRVYLARALEHSIRSQPADKAAILEELRTIYRDLPSYSGLMGTLVAQIRLYEKSGNVQELDNANKAILRLMKEADSSGYGSLLQKVEKSSPKGWKTAFLREELAIFRSGPPDSLSRALVELAEERNEDFLKTQNQSSLEEAESLLEEVLPLLRASQSLGTARLLQRVSRVINQHVVNEDLEREAMGRVLLAGGSVAYGQLGGCRLRAGDMAGTEVCIRVEGMEDEATLSRLNRGLKIVYSL